MASVAAGREVLINGPDLDGGGVIYTVPGGQYFFPEMVKFIVGNVSLDPYYPVVDYIDATAGEIAMFQSRDPLPPGVTSFVTFAVGLTRLEQPVGTNTISNCPLPPIGLGEASKIQLRISDGQGGFSGNFPIEEVRIYGYYAARDVDEPIKVAPFTPLFVYAEPTG